MKNKEIINGKKANRMLRYGDIVKNIRITM